MLKLPNQKIEIKKKEYLSQNLVKLPKIMVLILHCISVLNVHK